MPLCQVPRSLRDSGNHFGSLGDAPPTAEGGPRGQSGRNSRSPLSEEAPGARLAPYSWLAGPQVWLRNNLSGPTWNGPQTRHTDEAWRPPLILLAGPARPCGVGGEGRKHFHSPQERESRTSPGRSRPQGTPSPCPISATGPSPGPAGSPCLRRRLPEPSSQLPPPTPPPPTALPPPSSGGGKTFLPAGRGEAGAGRGDPAREPPASRRKMTRSP